MTFLESDYLERDPYRKVPSLTTRWDNPQELVDGTCTIAKPDITMAKMKTVPKAIRERFGITKATTAADILGAPFTVATEIEVKETVVV